MTNLSTSEIEVRFLNIDKPKLIAKLKSLGAKDFGEQLLKELIFYDQKLTWRDEGKVVRIRQTEEKITLAFKHHTAHTIEGATEIELIINSVEEAALFLEKLDLRHFRTQEKKRHTFILNSAIIDIDTWPTLPPYVEIEVKKEKEQLQEVAQKLGFDWKDAIFENAKIVIEKYYNIPVATLSYFTFEKIQ